jgi:hypothetical protein
MGTTDKTYVSMHFLLGLRHPHISGHGAERLNAMLAQIIKKKGSFRTWFGELPVLSGANDHVSDQHK